MGARTVVSVCLDGPGASTLPKPQSWTRRSARSFLPSQRLLIRAHLVPVSASRWQRCDNYMIDTHAGPLRGTFLSSPPSQYSPECQNK